MFPTLTLNSCFKPKQNLTSLSHTQVLEFRSFCRSHILKDLLCIFRQLGSCAECLRSVTGSDASVTGADRQAAEWHLSSPAAPIPVPTALSGWFLAGMGNPTRTGPKPSPWARGHLGRLRRKDGEGELTLPLLISGMRQTLVGVRSLTWSGSHRV